jgi:hypothetical protein
VKDEGWISYHEAVETIRGRLKCPVGPAQARLREACGAGEVRYQPDLRRPVLLTADDGMIDFSFRPGALNKMGVNRTGVNTSRPITENDEFNKDDLAYWLDQQVSPKSEKPKRRRRNFLQEAVKPTLAELFPDGVPDQSTLPNKMLCGRVRSALPGPVSDNTILRAAGRRK